MDLYPWIVFLHALGGFGFVLGHGASAIAAFTIREEREPQRVAALLDQSSRSLGVTYGSLGLLIVAGVIAGFAGAWWGSAWIWLAIGVLVVVLGAMGAIATPYYRKVRQAVGIRSPRDPADAPPPEPMPAAELAALLKDPQPIALGLIGVIGLALIIWLMIFKPF